MADTEQAESEPEERRGEDGFVVCADGSRLAEAFDGFEDGAEYGDAGLDRRRGQDAAEDLSVGSKEASVTVVNGPVPSPPQGLAGTVSGLDVSLTWEANPEADLLGYRLFRDGEPVRDRDIADFDHFAASSESGSSYGAEKAFDGDPAT